MMLFSLGFSLWSFLVWRLTGMPSPGWAGRIIPAAWLIAGILSGKMKAGRLEAVIFAGFTIASISWMTAPGAFPVAALAASTGLVAWSIRVVSEKGGRVIPAVLPVLALGLLTAEVNSDEVRFAEIAAGVTGIESSRFGSMNMRSGDIDPSTGHHTMLFPVMLSPGLLAGDWGLRIIPVIICIVAVALLAKLSGPGPAAAAALLYPGFSILGLAMTGWLATGLFTAYLLISRNRRSLVPALAIALLLVALKMRYAGLAAGIVAAEYVCSGKRRGKWILPLLIAGAGFALILADRFLLGGELFWLRYGNIEMLRTVWVNLFVRTGTTLSSMGWSLVDPEAGLFFRAPWVIPALYGLGRAASRRKDLFLRAVIPAVLYWLVHVIWTATSWHGLPAPAGRMFVPMIPLFALGMSEAWNSRASRVLIAVSAVFTALVIAYPPARANFADGTDTVMSAIGASTGISMVHHSGFMLSGALVLFSAVLVLAGEGRRPMVRLVPVLLAAALLYSLEGSVLQAEDLSADAVSCAPLYPSDPDPVIRSMWLGSRERMLQLSSPEHSLTLNLQSIEDDTLMITASSAGGLIAVNGDTIKVETPLMELPAEYRLIGRREAPDDRPENRHMTDILLPVEPGARAVIVSHAGGEPVFLDRIGFL